MANIFRCGDGPADHEDIGVCLQGVLHDIDTDAARGFLTIIREYGFFQEDLPEAAVIQDLRLLLTVLLGIPFDLVTADDMYPLIRNDVSNGYVYECTKQFFYII